MKKIQFASILVAIIGLSVIAWFINRDRLPSEIRIAAGTKGGFYYAFAEAYAKILEDQTGKIVTLIETEGSIANQRILESGQADLALIQAGTSSSEKLAILAPLFQEAVLLLSKRSSSVKSVSDLQGRKIILSKPDSGMAYSAQQLLDHFNVNVAAESPTDASFEALPQLDAEATIVTSSILSKSLREIARHPDVSLFPIEDAPALAQLNAHLTPFTLHRSVFGGSPATPKKDLETIATTACLVTHSEDFSPVLAQSALKAFYESAINNQFPNLINKDAAMSWDVYPLHPEAKAYFNPYEGLDTLTNFIESVSGIKELFFAFGAAVLLFINRLKNRREKERLTEVQRLKDRLDVFLQRTIEIEKAQMDTREPDDLEAFLDQVTEIKLKALDELTHEDLRADHNFSIFLTQCSNLIRKLQGKIQFEDLRRNRLDPLGGNQQSDNAEP